jgi:hypothetical protein
MKFEQLAPHGLVIGSIPDEEGVCVSRCSNSRYEVHLTAMAVDAPFSFLSLFPSFLSSAFIASVPFFIYFLYPLSTFLPLMAFSLALCTHIPAVFAWATHCVRL